ncbi:hypothetical protein QBZ16_004240 [Prototheca wickerhamii]|uniref:Magnesium transporter n=1 Tax=Prototheca wickerhamii TaxID=3111 RepID=A0AAD9IHL6_PROWI|nr:hypothetical protein QBZ16_004240 [Prototheca wickerhamii]
MRGPLYRAFAFDVQNWLQHFEKQRRELGMDPGMMPGSLTLSDILAFRGIDEPGLSAVPTGRAAPLASQRLPPKPNALLKWLSVGHAGEASLLELGKLRVTHQLGVQLRDLRLLDPHLAASYPSAILAREHALVINLEFIKCIITMEHVLITNLDDPNTLAFVEELQRRLAAQEAERLAAEAEEERRLSSVGASALPTSLAALSAAQRLAPLPFELRALELVLDTVSHYLERLTAELESAAHPALDALTGGITTSNLERVRRIKNRMVRLTTRVETLREVLEKFLDDDGDMHDMHLTAKSVEREQLLDRASLRTASVAGTPFDLTQSFGGEDELAEGGLGTAPLSPRTLRSVKSTSTHSSIVDEEVSAVEMLLEPYFMQVDNTYNKLQTLCEYIDDTEDYINIELDSHRNELIRLDMVLTALTASVALITAITSLFAMNLELQPGVEGQGPYGWFVSISVSCCTAALCIFVGVMVYCRWKRLL